MRRTPLLLLVGLLALAGPLASQTISNRYRALEELVPPEAGPPIAVADFDGDGFEDLLTQEGLLLNDGRGRFIAAAFPSLGTALVPPNSRTVQAADFTGDGRVDVLEQRLSVGGSPMVLVVNQGAGGFTSQAVSGLVLPAGETLTGFAVGDADRDGDIDIVTVGIMAPAQSATPRLWLNDATGNFSELGGAFSAVGLTALRPELLDLDTDGDLDLFLHGFASTGPGSSLRSAWANDGAAAFSAMATPGVATEAVSSAWKKDMDVDGFEDLILVDSTAARYQIEVHLTRPGGVYVSTANNLAAEERLEALVDVDGDPETEFLIHRGDMRYLADYGAGGQIGPALQIMLEAPSLASALVIDADGDGDRDLVLRDPRAPDTVPPGLLINRGDGSLLAVREQRFSNAIPAGDVDGDGHPDLAGILHEGARGTSWLAFLLNDGAGDFVPDVSRTQVQLPSKGEIVAIDLDLDGDLDFVVSGTIGGSYLVEQRATGFARPRLLPWTSTGDIFLAGAVTDFDGDGDDDLIGHGAASRDTIMGVENLGGGFFAAPRALWTVLDQRGYDLADVDGDGDVDIVVNAASPFAGSPVRGGTALLGHGGWSVSSMPIPRNVAPGAIWPLGATLGDLDGDGDADAILGAEILRNDGGGVFVGVGSLPGFASGFVTLEDMDGDGDLDAVHGSGWNENQGGLVFGSGERFGGAWDAANPLAPVGGAAASRRPFVLDIDRDGDRDVLTASGRRILDLSRQIALPNPARTNGVARLEVHGPAGESILLGASTTTVNTPFPGGVLLIDPNGLVLTLNATIPAGGAPFALELTVPPGLDGAVLHWQAALLNTGGATGRETTTIRDW